MRLEVRVRPPGRFPAPQEATPTRQHPVEGAGGATASNGVSGTGVLAAQRPRRGRGGGLGGVTPPREPPPARRAPQARSTGLEGT
jgi:hypothetical protein